MATANEPPQVAGDGPGGHFASPLLRHVNFSDLGQRYSLPIVWGVVVLVFSLVEPDTFPTTANFSTIFGSQATLVVLTLALLIPLTAGDYDLSIASVLQGIDQALEEAAMDLGASRAVTFLTVTLPLSLPGVVAGSLIVFTLAMSSYVTPAVLSGGRLKVVPMLIYEQYVSVFDWGFGAAMSIVLLALTLGITGLYTRLLRTV